MSIKASANPPSIVDFEVTNTESDDVEIELIVRRFEYDDGRLDKMLGKDYFDIEWNKPTPVGEE